jgi:hypothetical protein
MNRSPQEHEQSKLLLALSPAPVMPALSRAMNGLGVRSDVVSGLGVMSGRRRWIGPVSAGPDVDGYA